MPYDPKAGRRSRTVRVELTPKTMFVVATALACMWLLIELLPVVLVVVVGLMIAGALAPAVAWLESRRLSRTLSVLGVFVALLAIALVLAALTMPRLVSQLGQIVEQLPATQNWVAVRLEQNRWSFPLAQSVRGTRAPELIGNAVRAAISYSPRIVEIVGGVVTAAFLALYVLLDRDRLRGGLFALIPRHYHVRLGRILLGLETIVGGYLRGQIITSVLIAIFTFALLTILGVQNAVALSVFAGLTDVLPYVGGLLATVPAVIATFARGPTAAVVVLILLLLYQEFESRFIVPRVYGRVLRLPSAVVIVALLAGGRLFGIVGALLALPIAAGIRLVVEELRFELPGEPAEARTQREREEQGEREYRARTDGVRAAEAAEVATEIAQRLEPESVPPSSRSQDKESGARPKTKTS